jgi:hypothetical protein
VTDIPADSLRAVLDSVFASSSYQWVEPPRPFAFLGRWWDALQDWLAAFRETNPRLFEAFFWVLIAGLVLIFAHALYVMVRTVRAAGTAEDRTVSAPARERRDSAWYRRAAATLAEAGRYAEAMPLDFLALVLDLDSRQVVRFQLSKTPGEYAREARLPETQQAELRGVVTDLYACAFARRPCGPDDYAAWRALTEVTRYAPAH